MKYKVYKKVAKDWFTNKPIYTYSLVSKEGITLSELKVEEEKAWKKRMNKLDKYMNKKILYLYNFETNSYYRNKGYGTYLLKNVIRRFKGKYDFIHLNACPYRFKNGIVQYQPPRNGLNKQKLFEFYESCGFELHGITKDEYGIFILRIKERGN